MDEAKKKKLMLAGAVAMLAVGGLFAARGFLGEAPTPLTPQQQTSATTSAEALDKAQQEALKNDQAKEPEPGDAPAPDDTQKGRRFIAK